MKRCKAVVDFVRRVPRGHEKDPVEAKLARGRASRPQMAGVDGIERSAEECDVHEVASPRVGLEARL